MKIFAKYGTDEKVILTCENSKVGDTLTLLEQKYGGRWLWVDNLQFNEGVKFNDGLIYLGADGRDRRYCIGIETINK
jgi:hypothetical protein